MCAKIKGIILSRSVHSSILSHRPMLRQLVVHLNTCVELLSDAQGSEAFTSIFTSDLSQTWIQHDTEYDVHTDAHMLPWEWGRELHTTALLTDLLAFTLYMSSVLITFFVPFLCWSSSLVFSALLCWFSAFSQRGHRIYNIHYQLSGSCHGINSYCIWWPLNEMKLPKSAICRLFIRSQLFDAKAAL